MSLKAIHILAICIATLLTTITNAQQSAPYFSNKDIEKYKSPSDYRAAKTKTDKPETKKKAGKTKEQNEKEYWCKRAAEYKKKIEKAKQEVEEIEKKLAELEGNPLPDAKSKKALKQLNSKLRNSKKQFRNAERDLGDFENEAHRKGIPPGWLRCQFDW
jgi:predicted  nucleic acid-binding Zn-ribbon protein